MNDSLVLVEHCNAAATVLTLNRPDRRNALSVGLMESLCAELRKLEDDPQRRVVILRGAGPVFCAGLDLLEAADALISDRSAAGVETVLRTVHESPLVTIAAAQGAALGGGGGLIAACDFVVAAKDLRIGFPEVRRGLIPAIVTTVLRHRVRDADLRELFLLAESVDAARAKEMGLVQRLVPEADVFTEACRLAEIVCLGAPSAVRETKRLLDIARNADDNRLHTQAVAAHKRSRAGSEAAEGMAAFREKRPPQW